VIPPLARLTVPAASATVEARVHADAPPDELPIYRVLTGPDDDAFCGRVSAALKLGYRVWGSPAVTFDGTNVIVAQALLWPTDSTAE
jgi:hypothetical protein